MMQLYSTPNSTFSRRVRIALHEKGMHATEIDTPKPARSTEEYRAINPYERIPALVDDGLVLYESTAILEYLEEVQAEPRLLPTDPKKRARARMLCKLCDLEYSNHAIVIQRPKRKQNEDAWDLESFASVRPALARHYDFLAEQLAASEFLVGDRYTLADLCYVPFLEFAHLLDVEMPAAVESWSARLLARPSSVHTKPSA